MTRRGGMTMRLACAALALATAWIAAPECRAGAFVFAGEANGIDLILHPHGYTGAGGLLTIEVCIDPQTLLPAGAVAADLETPVRNAIATWNALTPRLGNSLLGNASNVPNGSLDFESIALHELGHCLGLAHVNAASESGLPVFDADYTRATPGANGVFDIAPGPDGIRGTLDDVRGDDVNLHWFRIDSNDPGALPLPDPVDRSTYARTTSALPAGHAFAQNLDRTAAAAMGHPSSSTVRTEAVMQQGSFSGEAQRNLAADDAATFRLAMSGADEVAGTSDDYTVQLVYGGVSDAASCDLDVQFTDTTGVAFCSLTGAYIDSPPGTTHARITTGFMEFGIGFNWFLNQQSAACTPTADDDATCDGLDDDCDEAIDEDAGVTATTCGLGDCAGNTGQAICSAGVTVDDCDPFAGAEPESCDGLDNDCNGVTDDGIPATPTACGVGECTGNTGQATCDAGTLIDDCDPFAGAGPETCDGLDNDCDGAVDEGCGGARLESGRVTVGGLPLTVGLQQAYDDPVVVTTVHYVGNTTPVVTRVGNVTGTSFDLRLQNPSNGPVVADDVSYLVVEHGSWTVDGVKIDALKVLSTVTSNRSAWNAEPQTYGQPFERPVVLGQVMSDNDPDWSVFFDHGASRIEPPSASVLAAGKTVAGDTDTARADEILGIVVIEAGHGNFAGVEYEAELGADSVRGAVNGAPFAYDFTAPFAAAPTVVLATMAGVDGADGAWAQVHGAPAATPTRLFLSVDEDQIADDERSHVTEQVAYLAFAGPAVYPADEAGCTGDTGCDDGRFCNGVETCDLGSGSCLAGAAPCAGSTCDEALDVCLAGPSPRLETVTARAGGIWTPMTLQHRYARPVVACTTVYESNTAPVVVRLDSVDDAGFSVRLQNPGDGAAVAEDTVHCLVVEEGSWTIEGHPVDAWRVVSTRTDSKTSWVGEPRTLGQAFANPVVLGQVMTSNDPEWSVYWQHGASRPTPPYAGALVNGKTVLEDPLAARADEELGFIVFEQGSGSIGGVAFEAALGADSVFGIDNGPPFGYAFNTPFASAPAVVVATMAGVDGADGGWAYVYGPPTAATLPLAIDEDQLAGAERAHTSEQVGYVAWAAPVAYPDANCSADADCDDGAFCNGVESCDLDTGGCVPGLPVLCDDGVACTTDVCNEGTGLCDAVPDDGTCDDGLYCNGAELCDAGTGCLPGTDPCGGDTCDEGTDSCPGTAPVARMEWGLAPGVAGTPTRVTLGQTFVEPVVVTSIQYASNTRPVVTRVTNVSGNGFDLYLQNPSGNPVVADNVNWLVVERGSWVIDGVAIEARKVLSTSTAHAGDWSAFEPESYLNSYQSPVVLGQVMSVNDSRFSTFWSRGGSRSVAPTSGALNVGKMVGEDPDPTRADEMLGFVVIESGHHSIAGIELEAGLSADFVAGTDNAPPYSASFVEPFDDTPQVAVVTQAGMDGGNGGWVVTFAAPQATPTTLHLAADEDQLADSERSKTTEQAAYCVFAAPGAYP